MKNEELRMKNESYLIQLFEQRMLGFTEALSGIIFITFVDWLNLSFGLAYAELKVQLV